MASKYSLLLLSFAVAARCGSAPPVDVWDGNPQPQVSFDTTSNQGWCFFCSDNDAPPLCNADCETAYLELCKPENVGKNIGMTNIEGNCEVSYFPPPTGGPLGESTCVAGFSKILGNCGHNASDTAPFNSSYCTTSGGGGTFGWNDDGSPMDGQARYTIVAKNSNTCGQHQHLNKLASDVIQWDDKWVTDTDQVVFEQNPPPLANFPTPPTPNPLCDLVVCNVFDDPYFASKGKPNVTAEEKAADPHIDGTPWQENRGYLRQRVYWSGWSDDPQGTQFQNSILARCGIAPRNWQAFADGTSMAADVELPHYSLDKDICWCMADAIYDASGGIKIDRTTFCEPNTTPSVGDPEFSPIG
ncbi:MAG: hypothetical protein Q9168_005992 [Polycauliona sp. 1 TL-2023]